MLCNFGDVCFAAHEFMFTTSEISFRIVLQVPPRKTFPQFLNAKKVPRDPGSRDRAFFALWYVYYHVESQLSVIKPVHRIFSEPPE